MARDAERLTALQVKRLAESTARLTSEEFAKLKTGERMVPDGRGLYLAFKSPSACSWLFRYMLNNVGRQMGLGPYPAISLARARDKAGECRRLKAEGVDPLAARGADQAAARLIAARAITFKVAAAKCFEARSTSWSVIHCAVWKQTMDDYVLPAIGDLAVQDITLDLIKRVLEPIWARQPLASHIRGRIEKVLNWAATMGYRTGENPARWKGHLENVFPKVSDVRKVRHHPALRYQEVGAFMSAAEGELGIGSAALRFTILTAARTGETVGAIWPEIDLDGAVWTIPAERMKADREHRVPLSKPALAILQKQLETTGGKGFIFPGSKRGKPLSKEALPSVIRRLDYETITVHGFRSTFRDWTAACTNFPREICEMALAHTVGNAVETAYRRDDLLIKRRPLMQAWANYCVARPASASIIQIREGQR